MTESGTESATDPAVLADLRRGLSLPQKALPPKYFYDERGSELFERITRLPEYYPTRAERALLLEHVPGWMAKTGARTLVELGAGSGEKTRIILDAMHQAGTLEAYVPVDVSAAFLAETARRVDAAYGALTVRPAVADITTRFRLPAGLPAPVVHAFLGSTIGNFATGEAVALLQRVRAEMGAEDRFLMGVDLRKDPAVIEAAYNDAEGLTAEFNRNMLRVLNRLAGADFVPDAFEHRAFYDPGEHRIEMHLVSRREQVVSVPGLGCVPFAAGESLRTEISAKYDRASVDALFHASGLAAEHWAEGGDHAYALVLAAPV